MAVLDLSADHREVLGCHPCILELDRRPSRDRPTITNDTPLLIHRPDGKAVDRLDAAQAVALQQHLGLQTLAVVAHHHLVLRLPFDDASCSRLRYGNVRWAA